MRITGLVTAGDMAITDRHGLRLAGLVGDGTIRRYGNWRHVATGCNTLVLLYVFKPQKVVIMFGIITLPLGVKRSIAIFVSVCLFVSLCWHISKNHVHASQDFLYMLHIAMALSGCDDSAERYVLLVFWMTPCWHNLCQWVKTAEAIPRHRHNLVLARWFIVIHQVAAPCHSNWRRSLLSLIAKLFLLQVLVGVVEPYILSVLAAAAVAKLTRVYPLPPLTDVVGMYRAMRVLSQRLGTPTLVIVLATIVNAAVISHSMGKGAARVHEKLVERTLYLN